MSNKVPTNEQQETLVHCRWCGGYYHCRLPDHQCFGSRAYNQGMADALANRDPLNEDVKKLVEALREWLVTKAARARTLKTRADRNEKPVLAANHFRTAERFETWAAALALFEGEKKLVEAARETREANLRLAAFMAMHLPEELIPAFEAHMASVRDGFDDRMKSALAPFEE